MAKSSCSFARNGEEDGSNNDGETDSASPVQMCSGGGGGEAAPVGSASLVRSSGEGRSRGSGRRRASSSPSSSSLVRTSRGVCSAGGERNAGVGDVKNNGDTRVREWGSKGWAVAGKGEEDEKSGADALPPPPCGGSDGDEGKVSGSDKPQGKDIDEQERTVKLVGKLDMTREGGGSLNGGWVNSGEVDSSGGPPCRPLLGEEEEEAEDDEAAQSSSSPPLWRVHGASLDSGVEGKEGEEGVGYDTKEGKVGGGPHAAEEKENCVGGLEEEDAVWGSAEGRVDPFPSRAALASAFQWASASSSSAADAFAPIPRRKSKHSLTSSS